MQRFWPFGVGLLVVLTLALWGAVAGNATVRAPLEGEPLEVVLEQPTLTPPFGEMCQTYWYGYQNERGQDAFLTLNAVNPANSSNSGLWQPLLPQAGLYRVEAYLPAHAPLLWDCVTARTIEQDTSAAHYAVQAQNGLFQVVLNQQAHAGGWAELGVFRFEAGQAGWVYLTDLNSGEVEFSRTVSFSAMRWTWLGPLQMQALPVAYQGALPGKAIQVQQAWAATGSGKLQNWFTYSETIQLGVEGINVGPAAEALLAWQLHSACGGQSLPERPAVLPAGAWMQTYTVTLPACAGSYTATVQVAAQGYTDTLTTAWATYPGSRLELRQTQAFDRCNAPSLTQLAAWRENGPYQGLNIYIGGVSRTCANTQLTRDWVRQAQAMGWFLIPTWVGPQAVCAGQRYAHVFSADPQTAFLQGQAEAEAAYAVALDLGLVGADGRAAVFYDLEGYSQYVTSGCRAAAQQFIWGWVSRMRSLGALGSVYGGACSSYMVDWAASELAPDSVWAAAWYASDYDLAATVWNLPCVADELWANHQRIRQYAGDHAENWGGVSMTIDSNAVDALVTTAAPVTETFASDWAALEWQSSPRVQALGLLDVRQGWLLVDGQLRWTTDGGASWRTLAGPGPLAAVDFSPVGQAWALSAVAGSWRAYRSSDGGQNWLATAANVPLETGAQIKSFRLIDANSAWLEARLPSSANFDLRARLWTTDGGASWQRQDIPAYGKAGMPPKIDGVDWPAAATLHSATWPEAAERLVLLAAAPDAPQLLWALFRAEQCTPYATGDAAAGRVCRQQQRLWASEDGGLNWRLLSED